MSKIAESLEDHKQDEVKGTLNEHGHEKSAFDLGDGKEDQIKVELVSHEADQDSED